MAPVDESQTTSAWLETATGLNTPIRGSCFLGRAATNHVVLTDDRASRRHAVVQTQGHGGEFWIVDLGSANGTYLNGRRVTQPCRLNDRDHIEMAGQGFTFRQERTGETLSVEPSTDKTVQDIRSMECWLLVADMEGSTQTIQKLPAHEVSQITARWLAACKQIVEDNKGAINKFLGDGFFAYWSVRDGMTAGLVGRALAALAVLQTAESPRFRMVVHFGKVFVGGASLGEENLMGSEVNFVFRIEKLAAQLGRSFLASEPAAGGLRPFMSLHDEGRHPVQSFEGTFQFFGSDGKPV
ncbi:MAG: adenylate cyclase [Verrucomicrobiota bacterium]|jgi:class 3 adenylate cyclase